ncbi:MAG: hypothetical protein V2A63_02095 [Patescibacteria group bacterium]
MPQTPDFSAISELHRELGKILPPGGVAACRQEIRNRICNGCQCCNQGTTLLPEEGAWLEENLAIPGGVKIVGHEMVSCRGKKGCKMCKTIKPALCQLFPLTYVGHTINGPRVFDHPNLLACPKAKEIAEASVALLPKVRQLLARCFGGIFVPSHEAIKMVNRLRQNRAVR